MEYVINPDDLSLIYILFLSVTHNLVINEHICNATACSTRLAVADERTKIMESVTELDKTLLTPI